MNVVEISSANSADKLSFSDFDGDNFVVSFAGRSIQLELKIYAPNDIGPDDTMSLVALFKTMSDRYRGWDGELNWASLEGQLKIIATSDSLGHANLRLKFRNMSHGATWWADTEITLEAMQVEHAHRRLARLFLEHR